MSRLTLHSSKITILAPAKLNLGLRIFPLNLDTSDGFHNLESWFVPLSWHDTLTFSPAPSLQFTITGRTENIPLDPNKNLITRAAILLASHAHIPPHAKIHLHKILPPGGGLGGGSSDAAHTLLALNSLWNLNLTLDQLHPLAAQVGSNVPFYLASTPSLCTGRGEIITPLPAHHRLFALLIIPNQGCPTKQIFQAFDAQLSSIPPPPTDWQHLATLPAHELNLRIQNDLAPPAYQTTPWLADLQKQSQQLAHQPIHLTGSGSTLFTLCNSSHQTTTLQSLLQKSLNPATTTLIPTEVLR